MSNKQITVATTISPRNIENQKNAIQTWIKAGFRVVSLNCIEEWNSIKEYFLEVEFVIADRDAREQYGKPYVYFDDFLRYFITCDSEVCGIINSDIHLLGINEDFHGFIGHEAENSMIFGQRVEIDDLEDLNGYFCTGYDYFFFDRRIASIYPEEEFCLGQPIWDLWIVFVPLILKNISVKKLINPIAYHIKHPLNWNMETDVRLKRLILEKYMGYTSDYSNGLYNDPMYIEFRSQIDDLPEKLIYEKCKASTSIVVAYNDEGMLNERSETYNSILNQTFPGIKIVKGKKADIDLAGIKEEYIAFISEGTVLDRNYIKNLVNVIDDKMFAVCDMELYSKDKLFNGQVLDDTLFSMYGTGVSGVAEERILYRTDYLRLDHYKKDISDDMFVHINMRLVKKSFNRYLPEKIKNIIGEISNQNIYIYGAGSHTERLLKEVDFSGYNICGIIDRNSKLEGKCIEGIEIYYSERIADMHVDYVLISSLSYEKEIYNEVSLVIDKNKLIRIYHY